MPSFHVRVATKHPPRSFVYKKGARVGKQASMFSADLVDSDGREARATFFGDAAVKHFGTLVEGRTYVLGGGQLKKVLFVVTFLPSLLPSCLTRLRFSGGCCVLV